MKTPSDLMYRIRSELLVILFFALTACSKPVPPEKSEYVGDWRSQAMTLLITQDGGIVYERYKGGVKTTINAPIRRFEGDDFVVGIAFASTTFKVSRPPYQLDGQWKMVVDGVELSKHRW